MICMIVEQLHCNFIAHPSICDTEIFSLLKSFLYQSIVKAFEATQMVIEWRRVFTVILSPDQRSSDGRP